MAQELRYPHALGEPLRWVDNKPLYAPYKVWEWLYFLIKEGVRSEIVIYPALILLAGVVSSSCLLYWASRKRLKKYWFFFI